MVDELIPGRGPAVEVGEDQQTRLSTHRAAVRSAFVQDGPVGSGKRSADKLDERHEAPFVQNPKQAR